MKLVNRTAKVPAYIFSKFDEIKKTLEQKGINIIDLGIGDPDMATPDIILKEMEKNLKDPRNYNYPPYSGIDEFKRAVADYYKRSFGVELDYKTEVAALIGSKEGIAHLFLAATDPEDYVLIPDPAYPVYNTAAIIAGCKPYIMPLKQENGYLPKLENIYPEVARKAKLMVVNYPNNPTGAVADKNFFNSLVDFGRKNNIVIANDGAYIGIGAASHKPLSIMQSPGAKEICVEFGTLSKAFNMTGWRIGYVVGNREIIDSLMVVKTNFDSGQFGAIQQTAAYALRECSSFTEEMNDIYRERRELVAGQLRKKGIEVYDSKGTFYIWFKIPHGYKSSEFAASVLEKTGVMFTPGTAFGGFGEGYCRISLTVNSDMLLEAVKRMEEFF